MLSRNLSIIDVEDFGGLVRLENGSQVLTVRIGDKYLSESLGAYELYDSLDALGVEFVEDIVEEENRLAQIQRLCEFHGKEEGFLLSLACDSLEGIVVIGIGDEHLEFVFVDALRGPSEDEVTLSGTTERVCEVTVL